MASLARYVCVNILLRTVCPQSAVLLKNLQLEMAMVTTRVPKRDHFIAHQVFMNIFPKLH